MFSFWNNLIKCQTFNIHTPLWMKLIYSYRPGFSSRFQANILYSFWTFHKDELWAPQTHYVHNKIHNLLTKSHLAPYFLFQFRPLPPTHLHKQEISVKWMPPLAMQSNILWRVKLLRFSLWFLNCLFYSDYFYSSQSNLLQIDLLITNTSSGSFRQSIYDARSGLLLSCINLINEFLCPKNFNDSPLPSR